MSWPPNPDKKPENQQEKQQTENQQEQQAINKQQKQIPLANDNQAPQMTSKEWKIIEKTMLASVEEQRRTRRWGIFFKLLGFGYLIIIFLIMGGRGCSSNSNNSAMPITDDEPHIAVIDVNGVISSENDTNASDINKAINEAYDNEYVKAVALRINSPGGSPVQSDEIWQNIMEQRKEHPKVKTYALIQDMGASGAYYIASATDEIYVNPSSLVGSIGVILPSYDLQGTMQKMGVKDRTMHAGEYKDILSMGREMTDFEKEHVKKVLEVTHQNFIDAVKEGRGKRLKDPEKNKLFTGLFWSGKQAIELGLADKKGGLSQLKKDLDVDTALDYTPEDPMKKLFEQFAVKMGSGFGMAMKSELLENQNAELK
ncbi:MAG: signal peptide peptidase SppA [Moraxellaceae bacterium]|nr:signal peptide peptidase SppA [Moraxellaceae bacterium]